MTDLDEFQRRVEQYFQCGQRNEPGGRIILDMMRALRERSQEYETLREAYGRLMQGIEKKFGPVVESRKLRAEREARERQPALGPLGMGSAEGIKNQAAIYQGLHDDLRAKHPDLPDLTTILQGEEIGKQTISEIIDAYYHESLALRDDPNALKHLLERFALRLQTEWKRPLIPHNPVHDVTSLEQAKKDFGPEQ